MTEWKECLISDLGTVVGGATPSTKDSSNYEGDKIAWITPKDLSNYEDRYISRGERNITEKGLSGCSAQLMPKHSVLFTSRAPMYYLLKYNKNKIEGLGSGTTFKEVSGNTMKGIKVKVPTTLSAQKAIGEFLNSIDCKIEENRRINKNLAELLQAANYYHRTPDYPGVHDYHRQKTTSVLHLYLLICQTDSTRQRLARTRKHNRQCY